MSKSVVTETIPTQNMTFWGWLASRKKKKNPSPKHKFTDEERKESCTVRSLKKQISQMESILELKDEAIASLTKELKEYYRTKDENKMWTLLEGFFAPKQTRQATLTESGLEIPVTNIDLDEDRIKGMLKSFGKDKVKGLLSLGENQAKEMIYSNYPQLSKKSINDVIKIAHEMKW